MNHTHPAPTPCAQPAPPQVDVNAAVTHRNLLLITKPYFYLVTPTITADTRADTWQLDAVVRSEKKHKVGDKVIYQGAQLGVIKSKLKPLRAVDKLGTGVCGWIIGSWDTDMEVFDANVAHDDEVMEKIRFAARAKEYKESLADLAEGVVGEVDFKKLKLLKTK